MERPRTRRNILKSAGVVGAISLAGCLGEDDPDPGDDEPDPDGDPEPITLRMSGGISPEDIEHREGGLRFVERVEELTDGQLEFDTFIAGELGAADEVISLVRDEVAAVGWAVQGWHDDMIPLSGVKAIPHEWESATEGGNAAFKIASAADDGILQEVEYDGLGLRGLFVSFSTPYQLFVRDERIETIDDLQGFSIRSVGGLQSLVIRALGADPVEIAAADIFPAIQRGTVDAVAMNAGIAAAYDVHEAAGYLTTNLNLGAGFANWVMNDDVFQSLDASMQDAIYEASRYAQDHINEAMDTEEEELRQQWQDAGILELYEVEDPDEWLAQADGVDEEWIERQEDPDIARQVVDAWDDAVAESID